MAPWAVATQNSAQGAKLLCASVVLGRRQMGQTSLFRADQKLGMTHLFSHRPRSMAPWAVATQNSAQGAKLLRASVVLGRRQMGQTSLFRADQKRGLTHLFSSATRIPSLFEVKVLILSGNVFACPLNHCLRFME
ncbi:hypothetical protein LF1_24400 [Rubripirellula obstinata]|uniref:Uncharacterized protein n=1 Tax=Rubripirellula obstinata TaxID=406547 RepID=A0A5B1CKH8_9BACT|nr:hypothetical protein LF1_24400 [Rubripirellula obstinata]